MGAVADAFNQAFRAYVADGVPASGVHDPDKSDCRALGGLVEDYIAGAVSDAVSSGGAAKIIVDIGDETTDITTGTAVKTFRLPYGLRLTEVRASLSTASATGDVQVDVNVAGVSVLADVIQLDATTTTSVGSAAPPSIATSELDDNAEVTIDIDVAGSGAKGLKVYMIGYWAPFGLGQIPYFIASGLAAGSFNANSLNVPYPADYAAAAGDIAIIVSLCGGTPVRPSGWTTLATVNGQNIYWRRLDGSESGYQAISSTGDGGIAGLMSIWRGCVGSGAPFEGLASDHATGTVMNGSTVVTGGPNRRAVTLYGVTALSPSDPDTGWTEVYDTGTTVFLYQKQFCASAQAVPISASIGAESRTIGGSVDWYSASFALVPGT